MDVDAEVRTLRAGERQHLVAWLDDGLRRGERGRLEAEFPTSLATSSDAAHFVATVDGRLAAHAMVHEAELWIGEAGLTVGMVGLVYTDPAHRGRGLASGCVRAAVEALRGRRVPLALLWSDEDGLYRRLGFRPGGAERLLVVDAACCERAGAEDDLEISRMHPDEVAQLERLQRAHASGARRRPGSLLAFAATPETELVVARAQGKVVGFAARGRGDDFRGVVHEWAGAPGAVLRCIASLCGNDAAAVLTGPHPHPVGAALVAAGASIHDAPFAWFRVLDAASLAAASGIAAPLQRHGITFEPCGDGCVIDVGTSIRLDADETVALLFDGRTPPSLAGACSATQRSALSEVLPIPLYLWGFDSI